MTTLIDQWNQMCEAQRAEVVPAYQQEASERKREREADIQAPKWCTQYQASLDQYPDGEPRVALYTIDGEDHEPCLLSELQEYDEYDSAEISELQSLRVGESMTFGGGAWPRYTIRRAQ